MSTPSLEAFLAAVQRARETKPAIGAETITVSETVSAAAAVYETVRNALEYDEEHLLRRNAVRRILKRHWDEERGDKLSADLVHELIWAQYLANQTVPVSDIKDIGAILRKYEPLFAAVDRTARERSRNHFWLLDLLSTEIEYHLSPPSIDEALASFAYQDLKSRMEWSASAVAAEDRDLQLYLAVHRAILRSNVATLRYRVFTLYYPDWIKSPSQELIDTVADNLNGIIDAVEKQVRHPAAERLHRFVQKHAVVYQILKDVIIKDPAAVESTLADPKALAKAAAAAALDRYDRFRTKIRRSILRAVVFLFLTKMILALIVELPYDTAIAKSNNYYPLLTNILFHPLLLAVIGLTVTIPEEKNTEQIQVELKSVVGLDAPRPLKFVMKRPANASLQRTFDILYIAMFVFSIFVIAGILRTLHFNTVSIALFIFFLSLVTFFGLKIRGTRRELVIVEGKGNFLSPLFDMFFLPIIRVGRWISLRAPRVNIFLFFFDFIIEAPFKAAIKLIEGWLAFLREKKEEI